MIEGIICFVFGGIFGVFFDSLAVAAKKGDMQGKPHSDDYTQGFEDGYNEGLNDGQFRGKE